MAQSLLRAAFGTLVVLVIPFLVFAGPDEDQKIETALAVHAALQQGQEQLRTGNYQAAVYALEREMLRVHQDIRKEYMLALANAYRGYISELKQKHRDEEAKPYFRRLANIDPGSNLEQHNPPTIAEQASSKQLVAAPPKQPETPTYRGKIDEKVDPFSASNFESPPDVRTLLTRADQEFKAARYQAACRLYQEANSIDPNAAAACKEPWAYCKLSVVTDTLLGKNVSPAMVPDLEREVRLAMSMTPKLDAQANKLLANLQTLSPPGNKPGVVEPAAEAAITVRVGQNEGPWQVLETTNFRILHNLPRETAEKAAKTAERTRLAMSKKWFGDNAAPWNPRCNLYLHATAQDYSQSTGVPATSPGHSTIKAEGERVVSRRIDIHCDDANWSIGVLPHETTHVVLAGRFGNSQVPRWADEGMAVLSEPRDRIQRHLGNLPHHRSENTLFNVGQLMEMQDYPAARLIGPFYAQSVSLVDYLSSLKGAQEYTAFMRDGLRVGYQASLKTHFGIEGYADLERRWQTYAFNQQTVSSDSR